MSLAISTVPFQEIRPAQESYVSNKFNATRVFRVPYDRRFEFAVDLVGGYKTVGMSVVYTPTERYPGVANAVCIGVQMVSDGVGPERVDGPIPADQSAMRYTYSVVTAQYGPYEQTNSNPENPDVVVYRQVSSDWADERAAVPDFGSIFVDGVAVSEASVSQPYLMVTDTWLNAQGIPEAAYSMVGKVNSLPMTIRGRVWGPKKVLYKGFSDDQQYTNFGASSIKLTYRLHCKEVEWTKMLTKTGDYAEATFGPSGAPIFASVDLNQLANVY